MKQNIAKPATPITAQDLADFVAADSDFGFEMQVLKQLRADGFSCTHAGTYRDPVTGKIRQYDVRASMERNDREVLLAVECKNLRLDNPLLLSAVPRTESEAFHDQLVYNPGHIYSKWSVGNITGTASVYKPFEMVGKKTDQVKRDTNRELVSNDEATFEKLGQAVNSCQDLLRNLPVLAPRRVFKVIVPVLVVPTGLLWQVDYREDGSIAEQPRAVKRGTYFLNHIWAAPGGSGEPINYRLSHVEVVTFEALQGLAASWFGPTGFFAT